MGRFYPVWLRRVNVSVSPVTAFVYDFSFEIVYLSSHSAYTTLILVMMETLWNDTECGEYL